MWRGRDVRDGSRTGWFERVVGGHEKRVEAMTEIYYEDIKMHGWKKTNRDSEREKGIMNMNSKLNK